ncbi:MAG: CDP-alcohol phosphatidyltransferase family protein [bacterium]|nr:CDP-alcohol phosphatidyltransferase family protein [bacterium]
MIGFYNYTVVLTYIGAACAMLGMFNAMEGRASFALLFLMAAGLCDMFDGTVAKTRKRTIQEKKFGIQIDSLADLVCFGVLPSVVGYSFIQGECSNPIYYVILVAYTLCALIRLAYFNVCEEERQQQTTEARKYYEGMPVTTVALILPLVYSFRGYMGNCFTEVYFASLAIISLLFVLKFKIVKLKMRGMLGLLVLGILEFIWYMVEFKV